jgi:hypothetical protein
MRQHHANRTLRAWKDTENDDRRSEPMASLVGLFGYSFCRWLEFRSVHPRAAGHSRLTARPRRQQQASRRAGGQVRRRPRALVTV